MNSMDTFRRLLQTPLPTERLNWSVAESAGVEVFVRRLDQVDGAISGNKAWKLQYHLEKALQLAHPQLLTFGGAWSNHLHATAAAGNLLGLPTIGVVRATAEEINHCPTPTLVDCQRWGMKIVPVSREEYREKHLDFFKDWLRREFDNPWIVPEGAGDALGVMGAQGIITPGDRSGRWSSVLVSAGTGATAAGLLISLQGTCPLFVVNALKGADMRSIVKQKLRETLLDENFAEELLQNAFFWNEAHAGGFGKKSAELEAFEETWNFEVVLPLDRVYTLKTMFALGQMLVLPPVKRPECLQPGNRVLFIHTGGLQGNRTLPG